MNYPTHLLPRTKVDRPAPDWISDTHADVLSKITFLTWQKDAVVLDSRKSALAKHFSRLYLYELVSRGEFEKIEKYWSGARAVLKLNVAIFAPANQPVIQGTYSIPKPVDRPALEFVKFKGPARELRLAPAEFIPSRMLVGFWERGLKSHMLEFTSQSFIEKMRGLFARQDRRALADAFAKKFSRMLSVLGNRQKHGLNDYHQFSENGRFSVEAQHQVLDRFPIIPDEATEFFKVLHNELVQYLDAGGLIQGRWGKLLMKGRGLVLRSDRREAPTPATKWKVAKVLE